MKAIDKPEITVREVFTTCVNTVENAIQRQQLSDCVDTLEVSESNFEERFIANEIYQIPQTLTVLGNIGKKEMTTFYDYRMVQTIEGRVYYNQIRAAAPFGKCPLCSIRGVDTLDHYLPKSLYPLYSVTPINLIPSCTPCNKGKLIGFPTTSDNQTFNPYYDKVENDSFVKAEVLQTNPISMNYYIDPPDGWTQTLKNRAANHFSAFNLNELFTSHANEELRGSRTQFINLYNQDPNLLRDHLSECYNSRLALGINSWQSVLYLTLLNDDWFCNQGVLV